jgi:hypothetical protein
MSDDDFRRVLWATAQDVSLQPVELPGRRATTGLVYKGNPLDLVERDSRPGVLVQFFADCFAFGKQRAAI